MTLAVLVLLLLLVGNNIQASTPEGKADQVIDLPGWSKLESKWFSGLVAAGEKDGKTLHHHYVLVEAQVKSSKKVLVWSNGGPGASSLYGLFREIGPVLITKDGMEKNPYAWNKDAHLVIINGPPPVGFSYCDPPGVDAEFTDCGSWTDNQTAKHNAIAISSVLDRHPRLKSMEWYFSGESYAGIYIPTLVRELLANGPTYMKIKGMAIGNNCMGSELNCGLDGVSAGSAKDLYWTSNFLRGHAQVSDKSYYEFAHKCGSAMKQGNMTKACKALGEDLVKEAGFFAEYNVYSECWYESAFSTQKHVTMLMGEEFCADGEALDKYVSLPTVRRALNVPLNAKFHSGDNAVDFKYLFGEKDLRPFYKKLSKLSDFRVLVYNGDTDPAVNVFALQNIFATMGLKELEKWRPWTLDGKMATVGYVTKYAGDVSFATVRGASHMVPTTKAKAAYGLISAFLRKEELPRYVPMTKKKASSPSALKEEELPKKNMRENPIEEKQEEESVEGDEILVAAA